MLTDYLIIYLLIILAWPGLDTLYGRQGNIFGPVVE